MDDVRLIHGDCMEVMRGLESGSVDSVVTDPPWMDYTTGWYDASAHHGTIGYVAPESYSAELYRLLRDKSASIIWCRWDCFESHRLAFVSAGFVIKNCIVWDKGTHTAGDLEGNLGFQHEMALFATKGDWKRHARREVNVWSIQQLFSRAKRIHPTEKPVPLMKRAIELACPRDGLVLDPFVGSGSTLAACLKCGRRGIGVEIDERYIQPAQRRIDEARTPLFSGMI